MFQLTYLGQHFSLHYFSHLLSWFNKKKKKKVKTEPKMFKIVQKSSLFLVCIEILYTDEDYNVKKGSYFFIF